MEILINQEPLNYTLESEESLGEVIDGLARWLSGNEYAITAIDVDHRSVPIHDRGQWAHLDVDQVQRLSLEAFPLSQVEQTTLAAICDYCVLLDRAITERDESALAELAQELPYVRSRLDEYLPGIGAGTAPDGVLRNESLIRGQLPDPDERAGLSGQLAGIVTLIEGRLREFEDPTRELGLSLGQLAACGEPLVEVPVQLQTGNESDAMNTVIRFTELLTRIIRILPLVGDSDLDTAAVGRFALDLTPHLKELLEAFEAEDSVLIGDLLEYEIAPRLERLPELVPDEPAGEE